MKTTSYASEGIVLLTTHERYSLFSSVLGDSIDARFDTLATCPLDAFLTNVVLAGGELAIIDEAHFVCVEDMISGLVRFLDSGTQEKLRLIIVCSDRVAGDKVLSFLVMYCGIYDIIFAQQGAEISNSVQRLCCRANKRRDVLDLLAVEAHMRSQSGFEHFDVTPEQLGELRDISKTVFNWFLGMLMGRARVCINVEVDPR